MTRVTIDALLRSKLHELSEPLELCDESGRVLARVVPVLDPSQCEPLVPQVSDEELLRRSASNEKTHTMAEVLAHLESL
jgi:hypothetical protein